jgi:hypothetical protein
MAALDPKAINGSYYGPGNQGNIKIDRPILTVFERETQDQLWAVSEKLTGIHFPDHR